MDIVAQILEVAHSMVASNAEKEVERLMKIILRGTPFANKAMAVGGYVLIIVLY